MPTDPRWRSASSGAGRISIAMVVLREAGECLGTGVRATALDGRGAPKGEFPYRAGGPARTWHLADSSVGCRGFIGPVPLPLLIRALRLWADATGTPGPSQTQLRPSSRSATVPQRASIAGNTTAEADSCDAFGPASRAAGRSDRDRLCTGSPPQMATTAPTRRATPSAGPSARTCPPPSSTRTPSATARASSQPTAHSSSGPASTPAGRPRTSSSSTSPSSRDKIWWGDGQPADRRGELRPPSRSTDGVLRRPRPVRPGLLHRRRARPSAVAAGLHRDRLGEHLRPQPVPSADAATSCAGFAPNFTIICVPVVPGRPGDRGDAHRHGDPRPPRRMEIIIVGTEYAGEIKKSAFTVMNYLMPDEGVLPMHSAINIGAGRRPCGLLRSVGDRQDDAVGRPAAQPHRRRRARLGRRPDVQLRGRLLRQDDPPLADVRARHLPDDPSLRDDPRERRPRPDGRASSTSTRTLHREHPRRLPARLHRQRRQTGSRARRGPSSSSPRTRSASCRRSRG